jgi:hypothetical protein
MLHKLLRIIGYLAAAVLGGGMAAPYRKDRTHYEIFCRALDTKVTFDSVKHEHFCDKLYCSSSVSVVIT